MAYTGLPLDIFGKDAFFQPYLPLQQLDMIKETKSWLCGTTNSILTQQKEIDLLVNTDTGVFEFRDPMLERTTALTAADRKWMDEIVRDVNETWDDIDPRKSPGMQFKGSDDYIRSKFEEYVCAALAAIRYRDFIAKGEGNGVLISGGTGLASPWEDFNPAWVHEFKSTNASEVWERITDPLLFDIVEPRHPCNEKPSVVSDIGLRLQEGIQELKLEQQLAPAREAVARTITVGSASFFKAMEGVRERWTQRVEVTKADLEDPPLTARPSLKQARSDDALNSQQPTATPMAQRPSISSWGAGFSSLFSNRGSRNSVPHVKPDASEPSARPETSPTSSRSPSIATHSPTMTTRMSGDRINIQQEEHQQEEHQQEEMATGLAL